MLGSDKLPERAKLGLVIWTHLFTRMGGWHVHSVLCLRRALQLSVSRNFLTLLELWTIADHVHQLFSPDLWHYDARIK